MEKNKEKLYDERTAINKKKQIDSMTRDYNAQKKEATLVMKMNDKNVRIKLDTGAELNVVPTRVFSQIANTEEQSNITLNSRDAEVVHSSHSGKLHKMSLQKRLQRCEILHCRVIKQNSTSIRIMTRFQVNQNCGWD